ncbi:MAG: type II toxin-antitoxin system RelE/ParE family toxin [Ottowia sp.]|nr:type II toxin-antitoxin system RelE/ParE family toxin [Ottowia sp.]
MDLQWTSEALSDLVRLHEFLAPMDAPAPVVAAAARELASMPEILLHGPETGVALPVFLPRRVYELTTGHYRILYELQDTRVYILRLRHAHEETGCREA